MIETAINLRRQIDDLEVAMRAELASLEKSGHARYIAWFDKYDSHLTAVISENKELLASVGIDGFSEHDDYCTETGNLPRDHPELIRIKEI